MPEPPNFVDAAVAAALKHLAPRSLRAEELAVTLMILGAEKTTAAHHRGDARLYPASVIKLFYLAAAHRWLEDHTIADTPELRRALRNMIVESSNEATGHVVDILTGATSGPELDAAGLADWWQKRNAVNACFRSLGYSDVNAAFKTWDDRPYGRDKQAAAQFTPIRNFLTTNATARLLAEIATGRCISPDRSRQMLALLQRDFANPACPDEQARAYIGRGLPPAAKLWSKAGEMSEVRHDAAIVELSHDRKFVLVIFTARPDLQELIPAIARELVARLQ